MGDCNGHQRVTTGAKKPQVRPQDSDNQGILQEAGQSSSLPTSTSRAWSLTRPFAFVSRRGPRQSTGTVR
jgi:hypothetical protein